MVELMLVGFILSIILIIKKKYVGIASSAYWLLELLYSRSFLIDNDMYRKITLLLSVIMLCVAMVWLAHINKEVGGSGND